MDTAIRSDRTSRLMITKMVLENFKSYAGEQEIGPFHKRFSSIVGPNGSGKSNVIDALLFVFGKRAKQLRLNKVSELIHKSSNFPNLEYARVSVHFQLIYDDEQSEDNYEVIDGSQFTVTRTAFQNNQSKYSVDARSSNYTEVGQLLRSHGIDLDNNRFLILQGEVEQIAMMKPKGVTPHEEGLLEYLEDIIGSNRFVEKIEETSKVLDEINEQRVEKVNRLKVSEKERDNLSGSKAEAEAFLDKERDIRRKKNALYQLMEKVSRDNAKDFQHRLNRATEKLVKEKNKLEDSGSRLSVISAEYEKVNSQYSVLSSELQNSSTAYDAFERRDVKLQEDMKHQKTVIRKHQASLTKETKREEECLKEVETVTVQIEKFRQTAKDFEAKKAAEEVKLGEIMEGLQDATKELRAKLEVTQAELAVAEKSVSSLQIEKESVTTAIALIHSRAEKAKLAAQSCKDRLVQLSAEKKQAQEEVKALQGERMHGLEKEVKDLEKLIAKCELDEKNIQQQLRSAVAAAEEAKATMATSSNKSGGNAIIDRLMKASKKGGPLHNAGVVGRLGDLATIAPEYDVAISTACGYLDYVVTETSEGAQRCIQFLRDSNLGRASFIALNQMSDWKERMSRPCKPPANTPRLFDLIQLSQEQLRPAFYMALRDTLVAPDLDSAVKIAYVGEKAAWRVVALDGNLIDNSGAMSGGGKSVRSGGMKLSGACNTKVRVDDEEVTIEMIASLEAAVVTAQDSLKICRTTKATAEGDMKKAVKLQKDLGTQVAKLQMAINRISEQEAEVCHNLTSLESECVLSSGETKELAKHSKTLSDLEEEIVRVSPNLRSLQSETALLQREILGVGGPKLAKVQSLIDSFSAQLDMLYSSVSTKEVEANNNQKQAAKASTAKSKAEQDILKAEEKLAALVAEQKEMEADAVQVIAAIESAKAKMAELEEGLRTKTAEYNELKALVAKIRSVEVDLAEEVEKTSKEIEQCEATAKQWFEEANIIRQQHIEEQLEFMTVANSIESGKGDKSEQSVSAEGEEDMDVETDDTHNDHSGLEKLPILAVDELGQLNTDELKRDINILEAERNRMKANVNMTALVEYMKKDANYRSRLAELEDITSQRNLVRQEYESLRRQRLDEFMAGFGVISLKLKEMYQMITLGGDAELELLDSMDPFSEGVVFSVRPPKKSWKNISNLSGGEKTLSSLALVFALHHYKPTPLYVMDEIDAALDFKNVSIVANYIKERTKNAQFVIISLRNNMFELADRLVGIYKTHDATKSVTINPKMFENAVTGSIPQRVSSKQSTTATAVQKTASSSLLASPLADVTNSHN